MTSSVMTRMPRSCAARKKSSKIVQRSIIGMDLGVVGDVVAVVFERRDIKGQQPQRRDAQILQIIELFGESLKIADAVAVAVVKGANVDLVNHRVLVPERVVVEKNRCGFSEFAAQRVASLSRSLLKIASGCYMK